MNPIHAHRGEDGGKMPGKRSEKLQFLLTYNSSESAYQGQLVNAPATFAKARTADACIQAILEKWRAHPPGENRTDGPSAGQAGADGQVQSLSNELRDNLAAVRMVLEMLKMKLSRSAHAAEFVKDVEASRAAIDRTRDGIQRLAGMMCKE
jgi:hypothetical protein